MYLLGDEYFSRVSKNAADNLQDNKRNKGEVLPTVEDIGKVDEYLTEERRAVSNALNDEFSLQLYTELAKLTVTSILVLNRRRPEEIGRTKISDYDSRTRKEDSPLNEPIAEKDEAGTYSRFIIRDKKSNPVPAMLAPDAEDCCDLLKQLRGQAQILSHNKYLFGLPSRIRGDIRHPNSSELIRSYAIKCNAFNASSPRGTKLRHHFATLCSNLQLQGDQIRIVAKYTGHDIGVQETMVSKIGSVQ